MRQPGIVGLHCVTTVNALHYAYQATGNDETRRLMLLQAAAFLPMFREAMIRRGGKLADLRVDRLEKGEGAKDTTKEDAIKGVFPQVSRGRLSAAEETVTGVGLSGTAGAA